MLFDDNRKKSLFFEVEQSFMLVFLQHWQDRMILLLPFVMSFYELS